MKYTLQNIPKVYKKDENNDHNNSKQIKRYTLLLQLSLDITGQFRVIIFMFSFIFFYVSKLVGVSPVKLDYPEQLRYGVIQFYVILTLILNTIDNH